MTSQDTHRAPDLPAELAELLAQLDAVDHAVAELVAGLDEDGGSWRPAPGAWSVAECLDHLAAANRTYLAAFAAAAARARRQGRTRRRPALPGAAGRLFLATLEPPPRWWSRLPAPRKIRPQAAPGLAVSHEAFRDSQAAVRAFVAEHADLDLAGVPFRNPFVPGVRFSLATGLQVIAAHERRHLWQAGRVRQRFAAAAERPAAARAGG